MNRSHEYAHTLLKKAKGDQHVLNHLADDPEAPAWTVGFHAQQAVEKSIKAVLSNCGVEYPRTHNLVALVDLLGVAKIPLPPDASEFARLTPYGAPLRYEAEFDAEMESDLDRD